MEPIAKAHPELTLRLVTMKSRGDLFPELPLGETGPEDGGGKSFFTGTLENALVRGEVDLCVHSLKDMADNQEETLPLLALAKRGDPRDILILPAPDENRPETGGAAPFPASLDRSRPVGTSSIRRRIQFLALNPGLRVAPIRGNVPTRLSKLDAGLFGALILAAAGLERLGITRKGYMFPVSEMVPAAGQGVIAVQGRRGEDYPFLDAVEDPLTREEVMTERLVIRTLGGGCHSPSAAFARIAGNEISITAFYAPEGGSPLKETCGCQETTGFKETAGFQETYGFKETYGFQDSLRGERERAPFLAEALARRLLQRGAGG
jgi:hydroxymethylbilane synthase